MSTVTLSSLRQQVREQADMVNSKFVSDSELNNYIRLSAAELYDLLVDSNVDYNLEQVTFSLSSDVNTYALPADFYKIRGLDIKINNSWVPVRAFNFLERGQFYAKSLRVSENISPVRYRVVKDFLFFLPEDDAQGDYKLWYVPTVPALAVDSDTFNAYNGYERYIIIDSAIKCLSKEESDTAVHERALAALKERIENMSTTRDQGEAETIADVRSNAYDED